MAGAEWLPPGDLQRVLALVTEVLEHVEDFPGAVLTHGLRELLEADVAGMGRVDLDGTESVRWADAPASVNLGSATFHDVAADHPLTRAYLCTGKPVPLRLSDVPVLADQAGDQTDRVMTIPLELTRRSICTVALMRSGPDFSERQLQIAEHLQPVLAAIHTLRPTRLPPGPPADPDLGLSLTKRELAVLDLMTAGLITTAIAHRLGISPRTVGKHIENIYRKLGTHDRVTTVLARTRMPPGISKQQP